MKILSLVSIFFFPFPLYPLFFLSINSGRGGTLLDNESPKARGAVARALGMIGDNYTATHLNYRNERETDEEVRKELHEAQGKIKSRGR